MPKDDGAGASRAHLRVAQGGEQLGWPDVVAQLLKAEKLPYLVCIAVLGFLYLDERRSDDVRAVVDDADESVAAGPQCVDEALANRAALVRGYVSISRDLRVLLSVHADQIHELEESGQLSRPGTPEEFGWSEETAETYLFSERK